MKPGKGWSSWKEQGARRDRERWICSWLCLCVASAAVFCSAGCAHKALQRAGIEKSPMSEGEATARNHGVVDNYQVGCPDILTIAVAGRPALSSHQVVSTDGRVDLGEFG